jgi:hypothetical protein
MQAQQWCDSSPYFQKCRIYSLWCESLPTSKLYLVSSFRFYVNHRDRWLNSLTDSLTYSLAECKAMTLKNFISEKLRVHLIKFVVAMVVELICFLLIGGKPCWFVFEICDAFTVTWVESFSVKLLLFQFHISKFWNHQNFRFLMKQDSYFNH